MSSLRRPGNLGFTLIEVIVALAILAVSFGVLLRVLSTNLIRTNETEDETAANSLLQSMLARLGDETTLVDGDSAGTFTNGFTWHLHIGLYGNADDRRAWPIGAHEVIAQVSWMSSGRQRSMELETIRLAPKEGDR